MQSVTRSVPVFVFALLAGVLRAVQMYAPQMAASRGVAAPQIGVILPIVGVVALVVSPFGVLVGGYLWGRGADVPTAWLRFTGLVVLAAFVGFAVTSLLMLGLLLGTGFGGLGGLVGPVAYSFVSGIGLVTVGLVALAGGAVAEFRDTTTGS